jgi:hypothetical protein
MSRIITSVAIALSLFSPAPASARVGAVVLHGESALARIAPAQPRHGPLGWNRHVVESRTPDPPLLVRCPGGQVWLYVYGDHGYRCVHVHHHY